MASPRTLLLLSNTFALLLARSSPASHNSTLTACLTGLPCYWPRDLITIRRGSGHTSVVLGSVPLSLGR
ncbi:hypothetical protein BCV70DRAFT_198282 [Testicularia cyperi]|uniref:Secreted protein n=1 Tax=Testicularia cyperi TaxID=1882483 RepID=A0A317XXD6_9BASI|nr:hypothetical protein BCV70DRAFT_198282 [Testicularia cyperi]